MEYAMSFKRNVIKVVAAFVMMGALAGCVVEPVGGPREGGWCYHHRC
jgi:uncharacterized membrane protein